MKKTYLLLITSLLYGCASTPEKTSEAPTWTSQYSNSHINNSRVFIGIGKFQLSEQGSYNDAVNNAYQQYAKLVGVEVSTKNKLNSETIDGANKRYSTSEISYKNSFKTQKGLVTNKFSLHKNGKYKYYIQLSIPDDVVEQDMQFYKETIMPEFITKTIRQPLDGLTKDEARQLAILKVKAKIVQDTYKNQVSVEISLKKESKRAISVKAKGEIKKLNVIKETVTKEALILTVKAWIER